MPPLNLLNPETPEIVADDRKRAQLSIDDLVYANKIHDRGVSRHFPNSLQFVANLRGGRPPMEENLLCAHPIATI